MWFGTVSKCCKNIYSKSIAVLYKKHLENIFRFNMRAQTSALIWHCRSWLRFQLQSLGRGALQTWCQTGAEGSWCCRCCKKPALRQCGPGTRRSWGSGGHWWFCPTGCARQSNQCQSRGDSRTCRCSPADTVSLCLCGWCSCRPLRQRTPHSTRSPSRSGPRRGPPCTAPGQSCRTSQCCLRKAAGLWCGWLSCCFQRRTAPCRLYLCPVSADRSL